MPAGEDRLRSRRPGQVGEGDLYRPARLRAAGDDLVREDHHPVPQAVIERSPGAHGSGPVDERVSGSPRHEAEVGGYVAAEAATPPKHGCKGQNDCKGQGGCKTT